MKEKNFDYQLAKELSLVMENEHEVYKKEEMLAENYKKKWNKSKFDFVKANKGVKNLIVTPFIRKYQNQWGMKVPNNVREAVTKNTFRRVMRVTRRKK